MEATASTVSVNAEEDLDEYTPAKLVKALEVSRIVRISPQDIRARSNKFYHVHFLPSCVV